MDEGWAIISVLYQLNKRCPYRFTETEDCCKDNVKNGAPWVSIATKEGGQNVNQPIFPRQVNSKTVDRLDWRRNPTLVIKKHSATCTKPYPWALGAEERINRINELRKKVKDAATKVRDGNAFDYDQMVSNYMSKTDVWLFTLDIITKLDKYTKEK
ncbi:hypothetical protein SCUP515_06277 [Seiridium cupressi]